MKKTGRGKLPPTIRLLARRRRNAEEDPDFQSMSHRPNGKRMKYPVDVDSFDWENTPEGHRFWWDVYDDRRWYRYTYSKTTNVYFRLITRIRKKIIIWRAH